LTMQLITAAAAAAAAAAAGSSTKSCGCNANVGVAVCCVVQHITVRLPPTASSSSSGIRQQVTADQVEIIREAKWRSVALRGCSKAS
jgi:hypothetical protein